MSCRTKLIEAIRQALANESDEDVVRCLHQVHPLFKDTFCYLGIPTIIQNPITPVDLEGRLHDNSRKLRGARKRPRALSRVPVESSAVNSVGYDEILEVLTI